MMGTNRKQNIAIVQESLTQVSRLSFRRVLLRLAMNSNFFSFSSNNDREFGFSCASRVAFCRDNQNNTGETPRPHCVCVCVYEGITPLNTPLRMRVRKTHPLDVLPPVMVNERKREKACPD